MAGKGDGLRAGEIDIVALEEVCDFFLEKACKAIFSFDTRDLWDRAGHCMLFVCWCSGKLCVDTDNDGCDWLLRINPMHLFYGGAPQTPRLASLEYH
jgi:hypothetical protein